MFLGALLFCICNCVSHATILIIDTDPGVDDAGALLLPLSRHFRRSAKLLAITTVSGNANATQGALNAFRVLKLANATEVPIHIGASKPLVNKYQPDNFFGMDALGDRFDTQPVLNIRETDDVLMKASKEHAVDAIIRLARTHKGQISLAAIGPLTNLALAIRLEPNLKHWLKAVYIMGGNTHAIGNIKPTAEFNFYEDPEAAFIVLHEFNATFIPWELCMNNPVPWVCQACIGLGALNGVDTIVQEWYHTRFASTLTPKSRFLRAIGEKSMHAQEKGKEPFYFVDAVAVGIALQPSLATNVTRRSVTVELHGTETRGQGVVDWRDNRAGPPNANIVMGYDVRELQRLMQEAVM